MKRHEDKGRPVVKIAKEIGNPFELFSITRKFPQEDFGSVLSGTQRALIGHCRSSTVGESSRANAHPFVFENIIGTHNGTISLTSRQEFDSFKYFDTDSQMLFSDLNDGGINSVLEHLNDSWDAYALVWYDRKENTINFLRNAKRPLYYAFDKDRKQLFWSSEAGHLVAAFISETDPIPHPDTPPEKWIYELPVGMHFSWVIPPNTEAFDKAHAVKKEARREDPFTRTGGSTSDELGYYFVNVDGTAPWDEYGDDSKPYDSRGSNFGQRQADGTFAYWDAVNWVYKLLGHGRVEYSFTGQSPWYSNVQKAWEALPFIVRVDKYFKKQYPALVYISGDVTAAAFRRQEAVKKSTDEHGRQLLEENKGTVTVVHVDGQGKVVGYDEGAARKRLVQKLLDSRRETLEKIRGKDAPGHPVFFDARRAAFYLPERKMYEVWELSDTQAQQWDKTEMPNAPEWVPFTKHDVQARHMWATVGKKKNKLRAYRGFHGSLLVRPVFEKLMAAGCMSCQRKPEWGNEVAFISQAHFFCEHCARDKERVQEYVKMSA